MKEIINTIDFEVDRIEIEKRKQRIRKYGTTRGSTVYRCASMYRITGKGFTAGNREGK
jgi:hypothetical protein